MTHESSFDAPPPEVYRGFTLRVVQRQQVSVYDGRGDFCGRFVSLAAAKRWVDARLGR